MIAPLQCISCNVPLAVIDSSSLTCPFCGAINPMPKRHREALRLTRDLDETTRRAVHEWSRLNQLSVPRWWFICTACASFVLLAAGLAAILLGCLAWPASRRLLPRISGFTIWLPLIPIQALAAAVGIKAILVNGAAAVGAAFAAAPPSAEGIPPNCRQCGAPLSVRQGDVLVRCVFCEAESLIGLDQAAMNDLRTRVGSAQSSLAQAMAALKRRVRVVRFETRGRALVGAAFLVPPIIWSFFPGVPASFWSALIVLDVWLLAICMFWYAREPFLERVTIEELDVLIHGAGDSSSDDNRGRARRMAGTRGWYDHTAEKRNFVIPSVLAVMFLIIELLVLQG